MPVALLTCGLFLSGLGIVPISGDASARSLQEELQHLLNTHPLLQADKQDIEEAKEGIREAQAGYFPKVSLSGDIGKEYVDSPARRSVQQEDFFDTRRATKLTVTQNLFDGFKTSSKEQIAKLRKGESTTDFYIRQ